MSVPLLTGMCIPAQLVLPDGSRTLCKQGDVVVQRGTDHQWVNASDTEWARKSRSSPCHPSSRVESKADDGKHTGMVYVLLPAKPVVIKGEELPAKSIH